jgi:O-methyltransferase involved in polyketide biosynthesis
VSDSQLGWVPGDVDLTQPSSARMYDYYLGGAHNFDVDRQLARQVMEWAPDMPQAVRANRAFLHRSVRHLINQGIRQFIDIGSGIPTEGNTHETAHRIDPQARVVYVDRDPVAVVHSELLLNDVPNVGVLAADFRDPDRILGSDEVNSVIDLSQPVGILVVAVLHFVPEDDQPGELLAQFRDAVVPGSYLVMSHGSHDSSQESMGEVASLYHSASDQLTHRSRSQIEDLFAGWNIIDPGVVWVPEWRPDWADHVGDDPSRCGFAAAVGVKP